MRATKPNFFIIGAPKCGTTSLADYLSTHPDVLFSQPKEPLYFHTDFNEQHRETHSWDDYLRCFDSTKIHRPAVGEGSVWYLYSRAAVPRILDFNAEARFIVMARDPVDLTSSLHSQLLYGGHEDVGSFEAAWRLQSARRRGDRVPRTCPDVKVLFYGEIGKVGEQVERLFEVVPRDQVKIVLLEDLMRDSLEVYRQVLAFLGLAPDDRKVFPRINSNRSITHLGMARLLHYGWMIKRHLGLRRSLGIWTRLSPVLTKEIEREPLGGELRAELREYFDSDVVKLSRLIGRDLSHWRA